MKNKIRCINIGKKLGTGKEKHCLKKSCLVDTLFLLAIIKEKRATIKARLIK
jgi:hypothetical protein